MLLASRFCFAVLLAAFQCQTQAPYYGRYVFNDSERRRNVTKCSWNCKVIESDLRKESNKYFTGTGVMNVAIIYRMKVDNELCANQTFPDSERVASVKVQIKRPVNNKPLSFAQALETVLNLLCSNYQAYREIKADCKLTLTRKSAATRTNSAPILPDDINFIRGHLAELGVDPNHSISTGNITASPLKWSNVRAVAECFAHRSILFFLYFLILYFPAFLCLFSPTIVEENGIRHICLEGASPIGVRSLIGNYFFSEVDDSDDFCHRTKKFIALVVLVPLPFLIIAIGLHYISQQHQSEEIPAKDRITFCFSRPFLLTVCFICYVFLAVYYSFSNASSTETPCFFCQDMATVMENTKLRCNGILPRRILKHMCLQPLILLKCHRLFDVCLGFCFRRFSRIISVIWPSRKLTSCNIWFLRVPMFIVLMPLMISFAAVIPPVVMLVIVVLSIVFTSPLFTTYLIILITPGVASIPNRITNPFIRALLIIVLFLVSLLALNGVNEVLIDAVFGFVTGMFVLFTLLFSEEGLSYLVCFVLVWYYLWSSYSSFTNQYHDLSLTLFKFYKQSQQHEKKFREELHKDLEKLDTPNGYEVRIPEGLFNMACQEVMPIRESLCILLVKVTLSLSFVLYTFLLIMRFGVGSTPVLRALAAFFTGSFPKILSICLDGDTRRKRDTTVIEEKVARLVQNYLVIQTI